MYSENIRSGKSAAKTLESLVFMRLSKDPSPVQVIRYKRKERLSRFCALILTIVMLTGIFAEIGKLIDITMANRSIRALQADNRLLEVSIGNLEIELMMKTQDNVICYQASRDLGMVRQDLTQIMVLPVRNTRTGETQLVSTGYQQ
ncbi:MAG: hypothetical protein IIX93_04245 [Clostridia bacterium]|nr:hypothetical protein [Clostridia bacterium]